MRHLEEQELWALAAGEVSPSVGDSQHLKSCRACEHRMGELVRVRALASSARLSTPSASSRVEGLERFERAMRQESDHGRRWLERRPLILPALGLSALAGAGIAFMVAGNSGQSVPVWAPKVETAAVEPERVRVTSVVAQVEAPAAPVHPRVVAVAPAQKVALGKQKVRAAPVVVPVAPVDMVAAVPVVAPAPISVVEVDVEPRWPMVAAARELLEDGEPLRAVDAALSLVTSKDPGERVAALDLVRDVALTHPSAEVLSSVDAAVERSTENREALMYLTCEASVMARRNSAEAVRRCRAFVSEFPQTMRARSASYAAGTLAQEQHDCAGAVEDFSHALVFAGGLGSLNDEALLGRASCLAELGRKGEARNDLDQFLARYPSRRGELKVRTLSNSLR